MSSEADIENRIQVKGLNAPRITPADIDGLIVRAEYYQFPDTTVTVCCLTLKNGFNTVGESACADPANFDQEIGQAIAFKNAREKIWPLAGYALKEWLHGIKDLPQMEDCHGQV